MQHCNEGGMIPKGHTPNLLFTLADPRDCDEEGLPLGPVVIVHCKDLYTLVRDILMEQQTRMLDDHNARAIQAVQDAMMQGVKDLKPFPSTEEESFDIEAFYNGPVKIPPHDKESDSGPPNTKKDSPKKGDG